MTWSFGDTASVTITTTQAVYFQTSSVPAATPYNTTMVLAGDPQVQRQLAEFYDARDVDDGRVRQVRV